MTDSTHPNIFPALSYKDADAALEWLERAFGFKQKAVHHSDQGTITHAELSLGVGMIMLGGHSKESVMGGNPPDALASTTSIYVVIDDPDSHHARALAEGAQVVRGLVDQDYGSREYSARDLEGNLWSFGTYDPYAAA